MKRLLFLVTIIVCLVIINQLARSIYNLWNKQGLVVKAQKDLEREKKENKELKERLSYVQSTRFIEEEARNKLFLVKPGEEGVIIPEDLLATKKQQKVVEKSSWEEWLALFLGK